MNKKFKCRPAGKRKWDNHNIGSNIWILFQLGMLPCTHLGAASQVGPILETTPLPGVFLSLSKVSPFS